MMNRTNLLCSLLLLSSTFVVAGEVEVPVAPADSAVVPVTVAKPEEIGAAARQSFLMAGNRVRQGKVKDALRFYLEAINEAPHFVEAMADAALVYKHIGEFRLGREMMHRALRVQPDAGDLYHILGEVHQAWGLKLLEERKIDPATQQIHWAVKSYGKAIELAERKGAIAGRAGSYFRLGEICYYAHNDVDGARAYWRKVLSLHAATPELDRLPPLADGETPEAVAKREAYYRRTYIKVELTTWQGWAEGHLRQLDNAAYGPRPQPAPGPDNRGEQSSTLVKPLPQHAEANLDE